jgi:hypothetical protein
MLVLVKHERADRIAFLRRCTISDRHHWRDDKSPIGYPLAGMGLKKCPRFAKISATLLPLIGAVGP